MPDSPVSLLELKELSVTLVLALLVWAFIKRWVVPGWVLDAAERREERLRTILERTVGTADRAVGAADRAVSAVERTVDKGA